MAFSGGWRVLVGALVLSAGVVAPATASADPVVCDSWTESDLPQPDGVGSSSVAAADGAWAVGNGSFKWGSGSTILIWKDRQLVDQLTYGKHGPRAVDVNSSGVMIVKAATGYQGAARWQAGVYTELRGLQGDYAVTAIDVNERGDVLGESRGAPVVWPAGSAEAQLVPGSDESWSAIALADDGAVLARSSTGLYWLGASGPVELSGGPAAEVRSVRGSYAVGLSQGQVVRWDRQGQVASGFEGAYDAVSVNSYGQVLGLMNNNTTVGATAVWPDPDHYPVHVASNIGIGFNILTDEGDLYGWHDDGWGYRAAVYDCVGGGR